MKFNCYGLLLLCLLSFTTTSRASSEPIETLQQRAIAQKLWQKSGWLKLIHYEVINAAHNQYQSQVDDAKFFLAKDGASNPEHELIATLTALYQTNAKPNEQAQCRFPARLNWLVQQLKINRATLPAASCPEYNEWRKQIHAKHVTLVFPTYQLNSPSSMFGHTLLRLDPDKPSKDKAWSTWLSFAVSFGADIKTDDNSLFYAFKGLTGGYPGLFIVTPYFNKIHEYNRDENRDIWEYELNLNENETKKLVTHLWELKNVNFAYYFFDKNCSYRLLELLEIARPSVKLTDQFRLTAIPIDTVRAIQAAHMVKSIHYRPSMVTELRYRIDEIPAKDQFLIEQLTKDTNTLTSSDFQALPKSIRAQIIDAAYRLHRYRSRINPNDPQVRTRNFKLLTALNQYSTYLPASIAPPVPISPDKGHLSRRITVAAGRRNTENFAAFAYKMSFHDLEDRLAGFLPGAEINLGNIEFRATKNTVRLHRLDAVDIFSLTPRTQFFHPLSWRVNFGLERQITANKDQLVTQVNGGGGVSYPLWAGSQIYALATARLEYNKQFDRSLGAAYGVATGLLTHFAGSTMHIEFSGERFRNGVYRVHASYIHNFVIARNHSLKLRAQRNWQNNIQFNDVSLNYQYYF